MILTIRTDKPEAEVGLYDGNKEVAYMRWQADRELSNTLNKKIDEVLASHKINYSNLSGLVLYKGPGSFTGLRIGATVTNTIAAELDIPISGANGEGWIKSGLELLGTEPERRIVIIEYGQPPKTTKPKK